MELTGKVTGREFTTNRDGDVDKIMLQVEISDPDDIQTVELMSQSGEDTNPPDGSRIAILTIGESYKIAIASDDGIVPTMNPGEKKIYSSDIGIIKAFINFLVDGTLELNGNADFAVRFSALETAFNQFKTDYNGHTHATVASIGTPTIPIPITAADITPAKVDEVKLP